MWGESYKTKVRKSPMYIWTSAALSYSPKCKVWSGWLLRIPKLKSWNPGHRYPLFFYHTLNTPNVERACQLPTTRIHHHQKVASTRSSTENEPLYRKHAQVDRYGKTSLFRWWPQVPMINALKRSRSLIWHWRPWSAFKNYRNNIFNR